MGSWWWRISLKSPVLPRHSQCSLTTSVAREDCQGRLSSCKGLVGAEGKERVLDKNSRGGAFNSQNRDCRYRCNVTRWCGKVYRRKGREIITNNSHLWIYQNKMSLTADWVLQFSSLHSSHWQYVHSSLEPCTHTDTDVSRRAVNLSLKCVWIKNTAMMFAFHLHDEQLRYFGHSDSIVILQEILSEE